MKLTSEYKNDRNKIKKELRRRNFFCERVPIDFKQEILKIADIMQPADIVTETFSEEVVEGLGLDADFGAVEYDLVKKFKKKTRLRNMWYQKATKDVIRVILKVADRLQQCDFAQEPFFEEAAKDLGLNTKFGTVVYHIIKHISILNLRRYHGQECIC